MLLRKEKAGSTIGHVWENDGDVVEVPYELGLELLAIPNGGFSEEARAEEDAPPAEPVPAGTGDVPPAEPENPDPDGVKQPNKAASAEEWNAYALAQGLHEDVVANATRKQIVDHFNGGPSLTEG